MNHWLHIELVSSLKNGVLISRSFLLTFQVWCDLENFLLEHDAAINNNNHHHHHHHHHHQTSQQAPEGPEGPKAHLVQDQQNEIPHEPNENYVTLSKQVMQI